MPPGKQTVTDDRLGTRSGRPSRERGWDMISTSGQAEASRHAISVEAWRGHRLFEYRRQMRPRYVRGFVALRFAPRGMLSRRSASSENGTCRRFSCFASLTI